MCLKKWSNWVGAAATVALLTVSSCASMTPEQVTYTEYGAAGGALAGGAIGCGTAALSTGGTAKGYEIGCPSGVVGGALIGGIIGYFLAPKGLPPASPPPPPLPPPPPPPPPPPTVIGQKLVLRGIHFDFNKSRIRPGDAAVLDEDAATIKSNPNVAINVNGYCDAIGSEEYNLRLSDRRADAVVDYLVKQGIPSSQLIPNGYGKTDFLAPNDTAEGRAQNRRVELAPNQ
jgi:outer membrane protein OmpA-like peptidoglycan-associated protein